MACSACSKRKQAVKRPTSPTTQNTAAQKAEPLRAKVRYSGR